jgi:hypothetical protein
MVLAGCSGRPANAGATLLAMGLAAQEANLEFSPQMLQLMIEVAGLTARSSLTQARFHFHLLVFACRHSEAFAMLPCFTRPYPHHLRIPDKHE